MATIHDKLTPKKDATGLELVGRNRDGRYQYRSLSVLHERNIVNLTHEARVGLAVTHALLVAEWGQYRVYPMTRNGNASLGWGTYGSKRMWITRPQLASIGRAYLTGEFANDAWAKGLFNTVAHEAGHNWQHGTGHGRNFKASEVKARVRLQARLSKGWPKLDQRSLRDSPGPSQKKRARVKEKLTPAEKWQAKVAHATRMREKYEAELAKAERLRAKWEKAEKHAQSWLRRSKG